MRLWSRREAGKMAAKASTALLLLARKTAGEELTPPVLKAGQEGAERVGTRSAGPPPHQGKPATGSNGVASEDAPAWSDLLLVEGVEPILSYRTGWVVYEESLTQGHWVGRGWNGAGFINFYEGRLDPAEHRMPEAFRLEIDGQELISDWTWGGCEKHSTKDGRTTVLVTLHHALRPVTVKVHTALDGTAVLTRWLEITNTSDRPAALASVAPWSGVLQKTLRWQSHMGESKLPLYSLGYFDSAHWGEEGSFVWHEMPAAGYRIDGRYGRDQHRHPMFMLRNNATGEFFFGQLGWTGGYSFTFDLNGEAGTGNSAATMTFSAGPDGAAPLRVLAPGETVATPEVHLGLTFGDLDASVQAMHTHLRRSVLQAPARELRGYIESGIGPEVEITVEQVTHAIDVAIEVGAEIFFIDASWYGKPGADWWKSVGDWDVDRQRFPEGIKPFRDKAHAAGILWGLWMDAERVGSNSRVAKEHPDWLAMNYNGQREMGGQLDLTNPDAARWMESQIVRVIEENQLDFFRLDYNTSPGRGIRSIRDGYVENGYWRYYEAQYAVYDRLRQRFPKVIFENCAGGGARTDIGMVRRFNHTDITDWQIAPRSFTITNGMTMALPPEMVDRLLGGQAGQTTADFDFQSRLLLFLEPKFGFLYPAGAAVNPVFLARTRHWVDLYKNFVRPMLPTSRMYHHTPEILGLDPHGWGVLELASVDRTRGMCGVFQLSAPRDTEYRLHPRGLDLARRYKVTFENRSESATVDAYTIVEQGMLVRLEGALTSELVLFEAI